MNNKQVFYNVAQQGETKEELEEKSFGSEYNLTLKLMKDDDWKKYIILIPLYSFFFFWFFTMGTSFLEHFRTLGTSELEFSFMIFFGQGALLYILIILMGDIYWDVSGIAYLFNSIVPESSDRTGWGWKVLSGILAFTFGLFGAWLGAFLAGLPHGQEFGQPDNIFNLDQEHVFLIIFFGDLIFQWTSFHFARSPYYKKAVVLSITYIAVRSLFGFQTGGLFSFIVYFGVSINELVINDNDFPLPTAHFVSIVLASIVAYVMNLFICKPYPRKYMKKEKFEMKKVSQ